MTTTICTPLHRGERKAQTALPYGHRHGRAVSCVFFLPIISMRYLSILLFAGLYAFAMLRWHTSPWVGAVYLLASAACFIGYAVDKAAARAGRRRTPEMTLLVMGLACGWPGAVLAQQWLRHKSSKASFRAPFWATVAVNVGAFSYIASPCVPSLAK